MTSTTKVYVPFKLFLVSMLETQRLSGMRPWRRLREWLQSTSRSSQS